MSQSLMIHNVQRVTAGEPHELPDTDSWCRTLTITTKEGETSIKMFADTASALYPEKEQG